MTRQNVIEIPPKNNGKYLPFPQKPLIYLGFLKKNKIVDNPCSKAFWSLFGLVDE